MTKFKNKYRIESNRLQSWDYGNNGGYFITICTANRRHFFGKIKTGEMEKSEAGKLAEKYWHEIPKRFPHIELGEFIVMPNHIHGIITIQKPNIPTEEMRFIASPAPQSSNHANPQKGGITKDKNPMLHQNLSRMVRWYKGRCTFEIRKTNPKFGWQSNYHENIIRNEKSFQNISRYICNNPKNWKEDRFSKNKR